MPTQRRQCAGLDQSRSLQRWHPLPPRHRGTRQRLRKSLSALPSQRPGPWRRLRGQSFVRRHDWMCLRRCQTPRRPETQRACLEAQVVPVCLMAVKVGQCRQRAMLQMAGRRLGRPAAGRQTGCRCCLPRMHRQNPSGSTLLRNRLQMAAGHYCQRPSDRQRVHRERTTDRRSCWHMGLAEWRTQKDRPDAQIDHSEWA